jgi:large subunit ribosomal protein L24e
MKRNPRKLAWTKAFRRAHGKEMTVDSTLAFAARRNVPVRYNRDHVAKTLRAMSRVGEIRNRRERQFYKGRMKDNRSIQREADRKLVAENQHLLPPEERDVVPEGLAAIKERHARKLAQRKALKEAEMDGVEVEETDVLRKKGKATEKRKQRLIVDQGPENMDID